MLLLEVFVLLLVVTVAVVAVVRIVVKSLGSRML
jgi:hypothetical protein